LNTLGVLVDEWLKCFSVHLKVDREGLLKLQDWTLQDFTIKDEMAGVDID